MKRLRSCAQLLDLPCACRKSNPDILVVQPAQDRAAKNGPGQFDGARDRCIFLQRHLRCNVQKQKDRLAEKAFWARDVKWQK
jgi:hypothetical protein